MAIDKARVLASAQKQLARNNVDKAIKELSRIVREDPKDLRVRQKIAELLARQGNTADAMREFHVVAEAYERGGFYPKAAAIYKQMLRFEPDEVRWHLALGEIYQQLALLSDAMDHFNRVATHVEKSGNTRDKVEIYEKLVRLNPDSLEYGQKLADVYRQDGDQAGAFDVWRRLAETLEQRGDLESLVRVYERMSSLRPDDLQLVRALADLYLDRGDPKRALAKLQICFRNDPQDTETLNLLADAFVDLGESEKAVAVLKELAQIYESLGYEEYRNQVYDRISELDPEEGQALAGGSDLELPGGEEAVAGLELTLDPDRHPDVQRVLAETDVYLQYGMADKAQGMVETALVSHPESFVLHRALLRLTVASGDHSAGQDHLVAMYEIAMSANEFSIARACLARAVALDPQNEAARARLEAFEEAMGDLMVPDEPDDDGSVMHFDFDDGDDLGSALELSARIAAERDPDEEPTRPARTDAPVSQKPSPLASFFDEDVEIDDPEGDPEGRSDDGSPDGTDEFEFDDEEMQRLAAELSREIGGGPNLLSLEDDEDEAAATQQMRLADAGITVDGRDQGELEDEDEEDPDDADPEDDDDPFADGGLDLGDLGLGDLELGDLGLDDLDLDSLAQRKVTAFELGRNYYETGMYGDAVIELKRAVDEDDQRPEALRLLGLACRRTHDFRGAVEAFRDALRSGGFTGTDDVFGIMFELGVTYEAAGNPQGAIKIYKRILDRDQTFRDGEVLSRVQELAARLRDG